MNKCVSGVTRFNLSKDKFRKIVITIPSLSTQNKIVKILEVCIKYQTIFLKEYL
ncbi:restriction endonuclease subunit S [Mycoplasma tullyi]|uniref:Restriction endonuclease subunit S n=1 Tax=Mycoplasma tullyi TaxID=1612150 RepID=A0A7D7UGJ6_9MOLU|nr:restriction endonuclease subunit S [Mycoplasma tullyi]